MRANLATWSELQYQLDVQHAVGRSWFEKPEAYGAYGRSVVVAKNSLRPAREVCLFGARHETLIS